MAWNFRRRVKVIPGVYLNFSKSGISTSIGVRGASMTFGRNGTYLNTSVPFLGIYNRQKVFGRDPQPQLYNTAYPLENTDNIFSADIHELTSQAGQAV